MSSKTHADLNDPLLSDLKAYFVSSLQASFPDYAHYLDEQSETFFKRLDKLSGAYFLPPEDRQAMRCAAVILITAFFCHPNSIKKAASSFSDLFFEAKPEYQALQKKTQSCLDGYFDTDEITAYPNLSDVFHDAALSMVALKDPEDNLIVRHSLQSKNSSEQVSHLDWLEKELDELRNVKFKTFAGQIHFSKKIAKNIYDLRELKAAISGAVTAEASEKKILALYRSISRNLIDMISIADHKAGLLLNANAISLSLLVSFFGRGLTDHPRLWMSAILIAGTCALTVLFASLAARPLHRDTSIVPLKNVLLSEEGVLHYGNAARLGREDFIQGFQMLMRDDEMLEQGLLGELHFYSCRIVSKLKMVRRAYITMFSGILLSFLALLFSKYL